MKRLFTFNEDKTILKEYHLEIDSETLNNLLEYLSKDLSLPRVIIIGRAAYRPLQIEGENIFYYEPLNELKQSIGKVYTPIITDEDCFSYTKKVQSNRYMRVTLPWELTVVLKILFSLGNDEPIEYKKELEKRKRIERLYNYLEAINPSMMPNEYLELISKLLNSISISESRDIPLTDNIIASLTGKMFITLPDEDDFQKAIAISSYQLEIIDLWNSKKENIDSYIRERKK